MEKAIFFMQAQCMKNAFFVKKIAYENKDMILRVISGGQTGADKGGLIAAHNITIVTGGMAPLGCKNEMGSDLSLKNICKLIS